MKKKMLQVHNRQILETCPFEEYLQLPGWSHSKIKSNGKQWSPPTAPMRLGTAVHNYLLEPELYNHENISIVKPAAIAIKQRVGALWQYLKPELAVTCEFHYNGFALQFVGRGDLVIVDTLVVDIKVSKVPLAVSIKRFGYDDQQNGYRLGFGAKAALIIRIDPTTCGIPGREPLIELYNVPITTQFWEYQTVQKGVPLI